MWSCILWRGDLPRRSGDEDCSMPRACEHGTTQLLYVSAGITCLDDQRDVVPSEVLWPASAFGKPARGRSVQ